MKLPSRRALARLLALGILATTTILAAGQARAQTYDPDYPVCLQVYQGGIADYYFECAYTSIPQCRASASGRNAQCVVNPYFGYGKAKTSHHPHKRRAHQH